MSPKQPKSDYLKHCEIAHFGEETLLNTARRKLNASGAAKLVWRSDDYSNGGFRINLYRFLRDNIPLLNSCIWTWSRLSSAPGKYEIIGCDSDVLQEKAGECLEALALRIYPHDYQKMAGMESFLPLLFNSLFTDGAFAGFIVLYPDMSGIKKFMPIDVSYLGQKRDSKGRLLMYLNTERGEQVIKGDDFYYFGLVSDATGSRGQSILSAVPFVSYIEQQLVDDMRRTVHNAGYHRLHVQITPPEKMTGESDDNYVERINEYFDETVSMIKQCDPEDNPVTWDNVKIEYVGPRNVHGVTNSWFLNHRAMVEEICAGTNLSPFMLGYSFGTTHNWAQFKYDLVMRQVVSIQRQTARLLEWMGNIELALKGFDCQCRWRFDNSLSYMAGELSNINRAEVDKVIKLYEAGLISKEEASEKAGRLL